MLGSSTIPRWLEVVAMPPFPSGTSSPAFSFPLPSSRRHPRCYPFDDYLPTSRPVSYMFILNALNNALNKFIKSRQTWNSGFFNLSVPVTSSFSFSFFIIPFFVFDRMTSVLKELCDGWVHRGNVVVRKDYYSSKVSQKCRRRVLVRLSLGEGMYICEADNMVRRGH